MRHDIFQDFIFYVTHADYPDYFQENIRVCMGVYTYFHTYANILTFEPMSGLRYLR